VATAIKEIECINCVYYQKKDIYADALEEYFGNKGRWDFKECYKFCYKRLGHYEKATGKEK